MENTYYGWKLVEVQQFQMVTRILQNVKNEEITCAQASKQLRQ
jgi:hypothetical protein